MVTLQPITNNSTMISIASAADAITSKIRDNIGQLEPAEVSEKSTDTCAMDTGNRDF